MEPGGHGLDAVALTRKQQAPAVVFRRLVAVGMPDGVAGQFEGSAQPSSREPGPENREGRKE